MHLRAILSYKFQDPGVECNQTEQSLTILSVKWGGPAAPYLTSLSNRHDHSWRDRSMLSSSSKIMCGCSAAIGGTGLVLGIERVEVLLQSFLARLTCVDRAANLGHSGAFLLGLRSPKKAGPNQRVPGWHGRFR